MSDDVLSGIPGIEALELPTQMSPPQYVPVLNEIIEATATPVPFVSDEQAAHVEAVVQAVLRALGPEFDQRLAEAMSRQLHEQLRGLHARVRQAVAREVREAVVMALTAVSSQP